MATKIYIIDNLDCANCAAKIERKFNQHPRVEEATITFATKQLRLTAEDPDSLIGQLTEIASSVEAGVEIYARDRAPKQNRREHHHHHHEAHHECGCGHHHEEHHKCGCGHHHEEHHECGCGHHHEEHSCGCGCGCGHDHGHGGDDRKELILGGVLFVASLICHHFGLLIPMVLCSTVAYWVLGKNVLITALQNLFKGHVLDENFLMSIATIGAFCIGEFPEAVGVMLFYRVGEYFEEKAVARSRSQIMEAIDLRPEVVNLLQGEDVDVIPAEEALVGDLLLVRPGDRIPLDGVVVKGESRIDTAPITGEPVPVSAKAGDSVTSGCVNVNGQIVIRVEKVLAESMVTRILDSVENAAASKPKIDRFITRFARVYTPVVVAVAAATAIIPSLVTGNWSYWVYTALSFLVMSCPCALVLSVPLAFFSGIGMGSKKGILFKGGLSIEALARVKAVVMDKTGTLTRGEFKVQKVAGGHEVLQLCASCEQNSTHPIAQSIVAAAKDRGMALFQADDMEEISGHGIKAVVDGKRVLCGNAQLLQQHGVELTEADEFGTVVYVAVDDRFLGFLVISDTLKPGAKAAVQRLKDKGIATVMLTGDGEVSAKAVAEEVGIDETYAKLLPHQKLEKLQFVRQTAGAAMFVGDGINDAPVLAGADVGAAMGSGADAAIEAADVVFMTSDVEAIAESLEIARRTNAVAWQNVIFALAVKFAVMALGLLGFASMWLAVFADSGVAMLCVLNSVRMLYKK